MSHFFIDRPIFSWVIAIVIMIAGGLSILSMPVNQYPNIAAPAVGIMVSYPGASAKTVQDTVVQVIEQQLNGLDNLRYISSQSNADGSMTIIVTFNQGTNPDIAQVQVQNKLQLATPMLPQEVQRQGIRVVKYQVNFMMVMGLVSEDGNMSNYDLGNYIVSNLQDPLSRVDGVGDFIVFGASYAMRIWLDPAKLNSFQLTPQDISTAVQTQNVQISSGSLGGRPSQNKVQLTATIIGKTRLETPEQFENILLKVMPNGAQVRIKDVGKVELGADNYAMDARFNGNPSAGIALRLATGSNLLDTTEHVRAAVAELEPYFPPGVKVVYPYDTSPVVAASIESVVHTLFEAIVLVFLVMYLFLQNLRTTLIPTLVVPVVLLGTFGVLAACGFTVNILTMFAMVLAIGLLVDDAIVVVENVERIMQEEKLSPKEATRKSMTQIQGALVGIALVISAVFIPMAFMDGATGIIYRQFSITIVSAMTLSVLMALIFTPALCATMLKEVPVHGHERNLFFRWFNRTFDAGVDGYQRSITHIIHFRWFFLLIYAGIIAACWLMFKQIPTAFLPEEDSGSLMLQVQLPQNSSSQRTDAVLNQTIKYFLEEEKDAVESVFSVNGFNFAGRGQNSAMAFLKLRPFEERTAPELSAQAVAQRAAQALSQIKDAMVIPIVPPAIMEMGNSTGFDVFLQDQAGLGHEALMQARDQFLYLASQEPILTLVRPNGLPDEPQYKINVDDEKVRAQNLTISDVNQTMSIAWASSYINDFIDRGRVKKVYVQGQPDSRTTPEDFNKWYVRNQNGQMVPFSSFASGEWVYGSPKLERYNGVSAVEILGQPIQGHSTGEAMLKLEEIMTKLPTGIGMTYTGLSYEERLAGSQTMFLMVISVVIVFLCLAALYESWSIPLSVMLVVPLGILGAIVATLLRGLTNDVFFQIGMLTTMGLAAKNAILIVEFASDLHKKEGKNILEAALLAARMRLRPILMTSMAFILGVLPLALAKGASSGSQHAIGTGVTGGTLAATFLAIFFVPLFYYEVASLFASKEEKEALRNAKKQSFATLSVKENNI